MSVKAASHFSCTSKILKHSLLLFCRECLSLTRCKQVGPLQPVILSFVHWPKCYSATQMKNKGGRVVQATPRGNPLFPGNKCKLFECNMQKCGKHKGLVPVITTEPSTQCLYNSSLPLPWQSPPRRQMINIMRMHIARLNKRYYNSTTTQLL